MPNAVIKVSNNTYGHFQHLDSYENPIDTTIAAPMYCAPPKDMGFQLSEDANVWEAWPPNPQDFVRSIMASHCNWLASQTPFHAVLKYAGRHWQLYKCFPSFGHIHLLYAVAYTGAELALPWALAHSSRRFRDEDDNGPDEGPVYLPAELCICDCAIKAADEVHSVTKCETGPFRLLSQWLCEYGEWQLLLLNEIPIQHVCENAFLLEVYCVAWPADSTAELTLLIQNGHDHSVWLPHVIDTVASNRDIDYLVLQCAASLLLLPKVPHILQAIFEQLHNQDTHGPLGQWLCLTTTSTEWICERAGLPAVWCAATNIFNRMSKANQPAKSIIRVSSQSDTVVIHHMRVNWFDVSQPISYGPFMWKEGRILCH